VAPRTVTPCNRVPSVPPSADRRSDEYPGHSWNNGRIVRQASRGAGRSSGPSAGGKNRLASRTSATAQRAAVPLAIRLSAPSPASLESGGRRPVSRQWRIAARSYIRLGSKRSDSGTAAGIRPVIGEGDGGCRVWTFNSADLHQRPQPGEPREITMAWRKSPGARRPRSHGSFARRSPCRLPRTRSNLSIDPTDRRKTRLQQLMMCGRRASIVLG
jgi:hypothetical protein